MRSQPSLARLYWSRHEPGDSRHVSRIIEYERGERETERLRERERERASERERIKRGTTPHASLVYRKQEERDVPMITET